MTTLSFQIHVLKQRKWEVLKSFAPQERETAWSLYTSLPTTMGFDGKKFVEEAVKENGLMRANTLSFQIFDPDPENRETASRKSAGSQRRPPDGAGNRRRRGPRPAGAKQRGGVVESLFGFFQYYGRKLRGLDHNPFRRTKDIAFAAHGDPDKIRKYNTALNPKSDAYTKRYADEGALSSNELMHAESVEVLGSAFFTFVEQNLVTDALKGDERFHIGICCFAVGTLIRIERGLALDSDRGRALLCDTLRIFLLDDGAIDAFITRMATFLSQSASVRFVRAGAKCFELYESGDLNGLEDRFRATFEGISVDRTALAESERVAIFVVQIQDASRLRSDYGTVGVQAVIDDLLGVLARLAPMHGGKALKVLGDGMMCATDSPEGMVRVALTLLDHVRSGLAPKGVPPHAIRIGGHFDGAVIKDGDYFGAPVQLAALLSGYGDRNEACFSAALAGALAAAGGEPRRETSTQFDGVKDSVTVLHVT